MKKIVNTIASSIAILFGVCLFGLFAAVVYFKLNPPQSVAVAQNVAPVKQLTHDSTLYPLLQSVALNKADASTLNISYSTKNLTDTELGNYTQATDTIYVRTGSTDKDVVAHEYLHHVYARLTQSEKSTIDSEAIQHYSSDSGLQVRMKWYSDNNQLNANEIISVTCSEESDNWLTPALLTYCNKYIDRSQLTLIH